MYTAHSTLRPPEPTTFGTFRRPTSVLFGFYTASIRVGGFTYMPAPTHSREPSLEMRGCVAYRNVRAGDAPSSTTHTFCSFLSFHLSSPSPFFPLFYHLFTSVLLSRFLSFLCPSSKQSRASFFLSSFPSFLLFFFLSFFLPSFLSFFLSRSALVLHDGFARESYFFVYWDRTHEEAANERRLLMTLTFDPRLLETAGGDVKYGLF